MALSFAASPSHAQVMMLPGQFDVSPTGSALYTVPIEVPPGTAGMEPALTLDYNSHGGNGLLGVGWNLGGLPSIGRCPRTVAQDGVKGRVNFDSNDRFCMDGERLVVVAGIYGAANSEYRTEIEGFTKVIAYGTAGNGPSYFKAWTKSGQIVEFGNTADSRILAEGTTTARSWAANKISDTKGNYLTIAYTNDAANGQAYPNRIDYTGNAGASLAPYNSVRFEYEARPDIIPLYIAGSLVKNTVRLKRVKTYQGANVVRVYELAYGVSASTSRSRVASIKMCDGTGTNCLPATTFAMTTAGFALSQTATNPVATSGMASSVALYLGDWNGDGVTDAMTWDPSNGTNKWFVNSGSLSFTTTSNPIPTFQITGAASELYLGDWNGDAITDVMWRDPANGTNRWFTNNGALSFAQTSNPIATGSITSGAVHLGDWNGDGVTDLMWRQSGSTRWFTNNGALSFSQTNNALTIVRWWEEWINGGTETASRQQIAELTFGDWNGDGITDVMRRYPAVTGEVAWGDGDEECKWLANSGALSFSSQASSPCEQSFSFGDWNGDGLLDALYYVPASGANIWYVNKGKSGFVSTTSPITTSTISGGGWIVHVGDWNADGVSDVMFHDTATGANRWFVNDGTLSFDYYANPVSTSLVAGTGGVLGMGDWNGDGFEEAMFRLPSNGTNRWFYQNGLVQPDLLSSVTTGLGSATAFTHKALTQPGVYTKESNASYPAIDIEAPFYVVSRIDADDGVGGDYSSTYSYVGGKVDVSGRGFLGFRQQVATDLQTNVAQTLTFRQDYPFIGFVSEDKKVRSSVTLNRRANTYAATNLGGTRRFPHLTQAVEESKDLNGTSFPTVTSSYTYDAYGNPLTVTVSTPDGASRTTTNTYSNNATSWILGRLLSASVASTTPDAPPTPTGCTSNCGVSFTIDNVSVTEGEAAVFTVTKLGASGDSHSVDYATADGAAAAGSDYTAASGTLTFAPAETTKTVSVATTDDTAQESDEVFYLDLSNATGGAEISVSRGEGLVLDTDTPPVFSIADASATEGGALSFTVTKSRVTSSAYDVDYASADDTATAGSDYTAASGTVTFAPAETSKTVSVTTLEDLIFEASESVTVALSNPTGGATLGQAQASGAINDNDAGPSFSIDNPTVAEGGALVFTVTKSGSTAISHAVSYVTTNGTATAGSDYTAASGTLTFAAGETSKTVSVATTSDSVYESSENLFVNLSGATSGATIADSQGSGTITDASAGPSFTINDPSVSEGGTLTFTVTKSGSTVFSHAVSYATADGTATAGADYTVKSGMLTFAAGETSKTVSVATLEDALYEINETVLVNLSSATNGASIADSQGSGRINNDDPAPTFAVSNATATAGNTLTFTITKSGSTARSHAVSFATADGTALAGTHYTASSGTRTFTASQTTKTIGVSTTAGSVSSGSKSMVLNLSNATSGATIADAVGAGTISAPANSPPVAVNDSVSGFYNTFTSVTVYVLNNDSDPNGDPLTITSAGCVSSGCSVSIVNGTRLSIMGTTGGNKTANYTISDGRGGTDTASATVGWFEPTCGQFEC